MNPLERLLFVSTDNDLQQKLSEVLSPNRYRIVEDIDAAKALLNEGYDPNLLVVDLVLPN